MSPEKPKSNKSEKKSEKQEEKKELKHPQVKSESQIGSMSGEVKEKWERLKKESPGSIFAHLSEGMRIGVPLKELERYAGECIQQLEKDCAYAIAVDFLILLKKLGIWNYSEEELRSECGRLFRGAMSAKKMD